MRIKCVSKVFCCIFLYEKQRAYASLFCSSKLLAQQTRIGSFLNNLNDNRLIPCLDITYPIGKNFLPILAQLT
ncbi:hypothetical protein VNO78_33669 [Psophocarpus tetragonolobus]|uniref:Uncharacterized protein n=1 Tax=Psophocarpus tetragonolobus TaxID=3891 RepID=A0AAN9P4E3_PSOTE